MGDPKVPPIGPRIRAERERRNVTIRALARVIGVSPSLISQIETGKSQPSVSSLYSITSALALSLEDLFDASDADEPAKRLPGQRNEFVTSAPIGPKRLGMHLDDRELLTLDSGSPGNGWVRYRITTSTSCSSPTRRGAPRLWKAG